MRAINPALEPAPILRALIAAVPDDRLRDLVLELALRDAPSGAPATPADSGADQARPAPRRLVRGAPRCPPGESRRRQPTHGETAAERSSRRRLANAVGAKRGRGAPRAKAAGNGHGNGKPATRQRRGRATEGVSAETFWNHARKLSPKEPWRAVVRELDISNGAAREALRNTALPSGVAAAAVARFLTLTTKDVRSGVGICRRAC